MTSAAAPVFRRSPLSTVRAGARDVAGARIKPPLPASPHDESYAATGVATGIPIGVANGVANGLATGDATGVPNASTRTKR